MLNRFLCLILLLYCSCKSANKIKAGGVVPVIVQVTTTSSYCGGARPPEELETELATPKPYPAIEIFVRQGETNDLNNPILLSGVSDEFGKIRFDLPPGKYSLVTRDKSDKSKFEELLKTYSLESEQWSSIDRTCLTEWLNTPDLVMNVEPGGIQESSINIHIPCFWGAVPCANYKGPFPP